LALVLNTASSKQLDAKFAAATLCGLDLLAICSNADNGSRGRKKMPPQLVARAKSEIRAKGERGHKYFQTSAFSLA
jgi:hypothetical protein